MPPALQPSCPHSLRSPFPACSLALEAPLPGASRRSPGPGLWALVLNSKWPQPPAGLRAPRCYLLLGGSWVWGPTLFHVHFSGEPGGLVPGSLLPVTPRPRLLPHRGNSLCCC